MTPDSAGILIMADTINKAKIFWDQSFSGTVELRVKSANVCGESDFSEPLVICRLPWTRLFPGKFFQ